MPGYFFHGGNCNHNSHSFVQYSQYLSISKLIHNFKKTSGFNAVSIFNKFLLSLDNNNNNESTSKT